MTFLPSHRVARSLRPDSTSYTKPTQGWYLFGKRALDVAVALPLWVVTLPLWLGIALWIRRDSPGPILFRQKRVGRYGHPFTVLKFRTMHYGTPDLPTDQMTKQSVSPITRSGRFLRRASLDELPQLINVLRGEMSLVGPRPALPSQENLNGLRREASVDVLRPGITGWAQVNGRDELGDEEKVVRDTEYLHRISPGFDLRILALTIAPVLTGRGNR